MKGRIIVAGAIAQHAIGGGGNAWAFVQYILGFRRLGYEVYYVEHIAPGNCRDREWTPCAFEESANVQFFRDGMARIGMTERASLFLEDSDAFVGLPLLEMERIAHHTDLFLNMSGRFHRRSLLDAARRRAYLDMDPGFVQVWQEQYGVDMNFAGHDVHFTVGMNLGADDCPLPTSGIAWQTTLPPVVLAEWQTDLPPGRRYTTVADWRGYGAVEWQGRWYGQKSQEFLALIDLPKRIDAPLELCLAIHPDETDRADLVTHGWNLSEPSAEVATLDSYRHYVQASRGEFTAVKNGYAAGHTGWFSDRSACYLAAGRHVIVQETGIRKFLPTGKGLLTFTSPEEAAASIQSVESTYQEHAEAARQLARDYLDSDRVLAQLLERCGL